MSLQEKYIGYIKEHCDENDKNMYCFYSANIASFGEFATYGLLANFMTKSYIIGVTDTKLIIASLSPMGGNLKTIVVEMSDIKDIKITKSLVSYEMNVTLNDLSTVKFKANKMCIGFNIHKPSLQSLFKMYGV